MVNGVDLGFFRLRESFGFRMKFQESFMKMNKL